MSDAPERSDLSEDQHKMIKESGVAVPMPDVDLWGKWMQRALAAESRLAALEAERDAAASRPVPPDSGRARYPMTDIRRDFIHRALTYPWFVGDRDLFVDVARDLAAELAALRAEVEALVPLARLGLWTNDCLTRGGAEGRKYWGTEDFDGGDVEMVAVSLGVRDVDLDERTFCDSSKTTAARAVLGKEGT